MRNFIYILLLVTIPTIWGCQSRQPLYLQIASKLAVDGVYDCRHKAKEYQSIKGGELIIVSVEKLGYDGQHMINYLDGYLIDCSFGFKKKVKGSIYDTTSKYWGWYFRRVL